MQDPTCVHRTMTVKPTPYTDDGHGKTHVLICIKCGKVMIQATRSNGFAHFAVPLTAEILEALKSNS